MRQVRVECVFWPKLNPLPTGLRGRCPRCGLDGIFAGLLRLREKCSVCGLSFSFAGRLDGPVLLLAMCACIPAAALALLLNNKLQPSYETQLLVSVPLLLCAWALCLRPLKGWVVCRGYSLGGVDKAGNPEPGQVVEVAGHAAPSPASEPAAGPDVFDPRSRDDPIPSRRC